MIGGLGMCIFSLKCICSFLIMFLLYFIYVITRKTMVTVSMITLSVKYYCFFVLNYVRDIPHCVVNIM